MGVYTGDMVLPGSLPTTLQKLMAWTWVVYPKSSQISKCAISIERDDGTVVTSIPEATFPEPPDNVEFAELRHFKTLMFGLQMIPFEIPEETKYFKVVLRLEDGTTIEGNKLWIRAQPKAPQQEPNSKIESRRKASAQSRKTRAAS